MLLQTNCLYLSNCCNPSYSYPDETEIEQLDHSAALSGDHQVAATSDTAGVAC